MAAEKYGDLGTQVVRHTCDNKACVNPEHLVLGTQSDNAHDNSQRGARHRNLKLTPEQVVTIRELLTTRNQREVAEMFGVHKNTIQKLASGLTWSHIKESIRAAEMAMG